MIYTLTGRESASILTDFPDSSPVEDPVCFFSGVLSGHLCLLYPTFDESSTAVVKFQGTKAHYMGPPNDEACFGHPLRNIVGWVKPSEVHNSGFVDTLEKMNRVHHDHHPKLFSTYRHFFFPFKECVVEIVAQSYTVRTAPRQIEEIVGAFGV